MNGPKETGGPALLADRPPKLRNEAREIRLGYEDTGPYVFLDFRLAERARAILEEKLEEQVRLR